MKRSVFILLLLPLLGCVSATETPSGLPVDDDTKEERIFVSVVQTGRARGCRAEFLVEADVGTIGRVLVETQSAREVRPMVEAARVVRADSQSGLIILRFVPQLGIPGDATYQYVTEDDGDQGFRYFFKMVSRGDQGPEGIDVIGSYSVRPEPRSGICRVIYEFTSSSAKLNRDQLMRLIRSEAVAIRMLAEKRTR